MGSPCLKPCHESEFSTQSIPQVGVAHVSKRESPKTTATGSFWTNPQDADDKKRHSNRKSSKYIGSYQTLVNFLERCRETGCEPLDEAQFTDLLKAVELLNTEQNRGITIEQDHFKGYETFLREVFPAWGVCSGALLNYTSRVLVQQRLGNEDGIDNQDFSTSNNAEAVLHNLEFGLHTRGCDIQADLPLLLYGFRAPHDLVSRYNIESDVLLGWIEVIGGLYLANPYHNWRHAVDVFQLVYMALTTGEAGKYFNFMDILVLLFAAIGHDVGHTGTNNAFHVKTNSSLALMYNDQSPLENMHAHVFFEMLRKPGLDAMSNVTEKTFRTFRSKIIDAILATDMSQHFSLIDRFCARMEKESPFCTETKNSKSMQVESKSDRRLFVQVFTHMADLGHTCRPWDVHKYLVVALEEEFFNQGDQELELGIPIMPMMDRQKDSTAATQGFFLEKVVSPLLEPFTRLLTSEMGQDMLANINENRQRWTQLVEKHGKKTASEIIGMEDAHSPPTSTLPLESSKTVPESSTSSRSVGQNAPPQNSIGLRSASVGTNSAGLRTRSLGPTEGQTPNNDKEQGNLAGSRYRGSTGQISPP